MGSKQLATAERATPRSPRQPPGDFAEVFVAIGRLAAQEHYGVGRRTISKWLALSGENTLLARRSEFVRSTISWGETRRRPVHPCPPDFDLSYVRLGPRECERRYGAGYRTVNRWLDERGRERLRAARAEFVGARRLTRADVGRILDRSFPVQPRRRVSLTAARHAAQFLRVVRNGGFIVSPAADGCWRVGTRKITADELLDLAVSRGFDPSLTPDGGRDGE